MSTREWRALVDAAEEVRDEMRSGRKQGGRLDPNMRGKIVERALDLKRSILHFVEEKLSRHTACCVLEDSGGGPFNVPMYTQFRNSFVQSLDRFLQATGPAAVLAAGAEDEAQQDQAQRHKKVEAEQAVLEAARTRADYEAELVATRAKREHAASSAARVASAAVPELERLQQEDSEANTIANAKAVGVSRTSPCDNAGKGGGLSAAQKARIAANQAAALLRREASRKRGNTSPQHARSVTARGRAASVPPQPETQVTYDRS